MQCGNGKTDVYKKSIFLACYYSLLILQAKYVSFYFWHHHFRITWKMLYAVCCMLYAVCCMLYAVCCMLYAVCCMLYAVCCMLFSSIQQKLRRLTSWLTYFKEIVKKVVTSWVRIKAALLKVRSLVACKCRDLVLKFRFCCVHGVLECMKCKKKQKKNYSIKELYFIHKVKIQQLKKTKPKA